MSQYISIENEQKMKALLNDENVELIMKNMIKEYSKNSLNRAQNLLNYINNIVCNIINISNKQIQELNQASWMLIFQNSLILCLLHQLTL